MILNNLKKVKTLLPKNVTLVAVSKTKSVEEIKEAYNEGQRVFGENRVQEMVEKYEVLPKDIQWHMIGHLQRNKVKYMASFVSLIQGVSSLKALKEIDKQAKRHNRVINCLLQAKIAGEETKFGLSFQEIEQIIASEELKKLSNVNIIGLMGMATFTNNKTQLTEEFSSLKKLFDKLNTKGKNLSVLSMGMSGDYSIAIKCGSNMVRMGSAVFGERNYAG